MALHLLSVTQNTTSWVRPSTLSGKRDNRNRFCHVNVSSALSPVACLSSTVQTTEPRPVFGFPPNIWKDRIASFSFNQTELDLCTRQVEAMEEEVTAKVLASFSSDCHEVEKLKLIDLLCRLGLSYRFQVEIEEHLYRIFHLCPNLLNDNDHDLYTVAVGFRVFRQHGFEISSDVFKRFKNSNNGMFEDSLTKDPEGMLSLFEAAHLSMPSEDILDQALAFTTPHLERIVVQTNPYFANQVYSALKIPLHKGMPRMKAREYISYYKEVEDKNDLLLKFAILDFNRVQLLHRHELQSLLKWWKELDLGSKLPYARDRIVELYLWSVCEFYEPCYAYGRMVYTKIVYLLAFLDDTYEAYATYEEVKVLTDAIQRWNRDVLDQLPVDYMKPLYKAFLDLFDELDDFAGHEGRSYAVAITKDYLKKMARAYQLERDWSNSGYSPAFKESLDKTASFSSGAEIAAVMCMVGMPEVAGLDAYNWVLSGAYILSATGKISRFVNDLATYKDEGTRGYMASPFFSYMKEYGVSEMEAIEEFQRRISSEWKRVNEYWITHASAIPKEIIVRVINIARTAEVFYRHGDSLVYGELVEDDIKALLIDPVPV